jgi:undecaprenyl-diphosphatase
MKREISNIFKNNAIYFSLIILLFLLALILNTKFSNEITQFDQSITNCVNNINSPILTKLMLSITFLGSFTALAIIVIVSFFLLNNKKTSFLISLNLLIVHLFNRFLKYIYNRTRPEFTIIEETGSSLPSGHAMCAIAFYGLLIYLNNKLVNDKTQRIIFNIFMVLLIILIGFSRIYLNVHYFTDIMFGYAFGLLTLLIFINIIKNKEVKS